jgi:Protein of unknown function (DUF2569)
MPAYCNSCGLYIPDGQSSCRVCGSTAITSAPWPRGFTPWSLLAPSKPRPKYSRWMLFIGLGLLIAPALRIYALVRQQLPILSTNEGHLLLAQHAGLDNLIYFEIGVNTALVVAAIVLNILFYTHSKRFPVAMIVYVVLTFSYRLLATAIFHSLFPNVPLANTYSLVPYFIWCVLTGGYLLLDARVKARFKY